MTQTDNRLIKKIRDTLTVEEQKEFDIGLQATEKDVDLYRRLSET